MLCSQVSSDAIASLAPLSGCKDVMREVKEIDQLESENGGPRDPAVVAMVKPNSHTVAKFVKPTTDPRVASWRPQGRIAGEPQGAAGNPREPWGAPGSTREPQGITQGVCGELQGALGEPRGIPHIVYMEHQGTSRGVPGEVFRRLVGSKRKR